LLAPNELEPQILQQTCIYGVYRVERILDTSLHRFVRRHSQGIFSIGDLNTYETQTHAVRFVADVVGGNGIRAKAHG
jgi:hypothetical protein